MLFFFVCVKTWGSQRCTVFTNTTLATRLSPKGLVCVQHEGGRGGLEKRCIGRG